MLFSYTLLAAIFTKIKLGQTGRRAIGCVAVVRRPTSNTAFLLTVVVSLSPFKNGWFDIDHLVGNGLLLKNGSLRNAGCKSGAPNTANVAPATKLMQCDVQDLSPKATK